MEIILQAIGEYGIIAGGFIFFIWQNGKEKDKLMDFVGTQTQTLEKINNTLEMVSHDLRDIRRKVGLDEFKGDDK